MAPLTEKEQYDQDSETFTATFNDVLTTTSLTPSTLTDIIVENPRIAITVGLAGSIWTAANSRPRDIERIVSLLQQTLSSEAIKALEVTGGEDGPQSFFSEFDRNLSEIISDNLDIFDSTPTVIDEDNTLLTSILLQSVAVKLGIIDSNHHVRVARQALRLPDSDEVTEEQEGVLAVAALIVFASLGAEKAASSLAREGGSYDDVLVALGVLKQQGIKKQPSAVSLLERIILEVESRENQIRTSDDIWGILFPV